MTIIPEQHPSLVPIRPITWTEIFGAWREMESYQESWQRHWTERGFDSWDEWRTAYTAPLHPETLSWELYEMTEPLHDAPFLYGTPTKGWVEKAYGSETTKQLKDLARLPIITENDKVRAIQKNFPKTTMLTGLIHDDKIVLIEGMHRANALATWDSTIPFTKKVTIALAEWIDPIPIIGGNYKLR